MATRAASAAAEGAVGEQPIASSVTPGTLALVKLATRAGALHGHHRPRPRSGSPARPGARMILMLAWERADPRVDEPPTRRRSPASRPPGWTTSRRAGPRPCSSAGSRWPTDQTRAWRSYPPRRLQPIVDQVAGWLYGLHVDGPELSPPATNGIGPAARAIPEIRGVGRDHARSAPSSPPARAPVPGARAGSAPPRPRPVPGVGIRRAELVRPDAGLRPAADDRGSGASDDRDRRHPAAIPHGERVTLVAGGPGGSPRRPRSRRCAAT